MIVGVISNDLNRGDNIALYMRTIWKAIVYQHREKPLSDSYNRHRGILGFVQDDGSSESSHIYSIAGAALLLDIVVIFVIAYIIIFRRRHSFVKGSYYRGSR